MRAREVLLLEPILLPKLWGGIRFTDAAASNARIGEMVLVSGRTETDTVIAGGPRAGMTLSRLWETAPELFGDSLEALFPFQIKLIDAGEDLSVQVHPGARRAPSRHDERSKNECWYVLDRKSVV